MTKPSTDNPQKIKAQKIRDKAKQLTTSVYGYGAAAGKEIGIEFGNDPASLKLAQAIVDASRVHARHVDPENEDSALECGSEWHFAQYTGPGSTLVPLVYSTAFRVAKKSKNWFASVPNIARYLHKRDDDIYAAIDLLVADGFFRVIEAEKGKKVKYRPIGHREWAHLYPGRCTAINSIAWEQKNPELALLGKNLWSILGGERFFPNVLRGLRKAAEGKTDEEICQLAQQFMAEDAGKGSGKDRRKRFAEFLRNEVPRKAR
jgi:hypothetical protein